MAKKKTEKSENMICMPGNGSKDWAHTALAAVILIFAFMNVSWAQWIIVLAAAVIFISGIVACYKK
ncbi:MAG: hypothetical protein Q8R18_00015 [bacterium]|nr:hypothetical protein [bacterium]